MIMKPLLVIGAAYLMVVTSANYGDNYHGTGAEFAEGRVPLQRPDGGDLGELRIGIGPREAERRRHLAREGARTYSKLTN